MTSPVASVTSFSLQASYKSFAASGYTKTFTISGSCSGSGNLSDSAANTAATFEGVNGFSSTSTMTGTYTNCTPASFAQSSTSYYDTNYVPLGNNTVGVSYGVYLTPPVIPATVKVGDTGTIGTRTKYKNNTKTTPDGTSVTTYVVESDTANTAIMNLICCSLLVALSFAETFTTPLESMSKITSICGSPLGAGAMPSKLNSPSNLL